MDYDIPYVSRCCMASVRGWTEGTVYACACVRAWREGIWSAGETFALYSKCIK